MKPVLTLLIAAMASPALAQQDHGSASHHPPADVHAGHHMPTAKAEPEAEPQPQPQEAAHGDAHQGHKMIHDGPMEGHHAHAGHEPGVADPPVGPPPAGAFHGPDHAADAIFGAEAMALARELVRREHGDISSSMILIDQLEVLSGDGKDGYAWGVEAWYGGDIDKLWLKSVGEGQFGGKLERVELQALWHHALDPWWNLQAGVRHDFRAGQDRSYAVLGLQGLAPYWFEIDSSLFLSDKGDVTARIEAEYDLRLTQKLILQPAAEINFSAQDVPELGIGAGVSDVELGVRLRYQFVPEFAPYIGASYEHGFGKTADYRRAEGDKAGSWNILIGIRSWF